MGALQAPAAHLLSSLLVSARATCPALQMQGPFHSLSYLLGSGCQGKLNLYKRHYHITLGTSSSKLPACSAAFLVPGHHRIPHPACCPCLSPATASSQYSKAEAEWSRTANLGHLPSRQSGNGCCMTDFYFCPVPAPHWCNLCVTPVPLGGGKNI